MKKASCILLTLIAVISVKGREFENLGFEEADLSAVDISGFGPIDKMIPGWTVTKNGSPVTHVLFGEQTLNDFGPRLFEREGGLTLDITDRPVIPSEQFELAQQGQIPPSATELRFVEDALPFRVRINGEEIPPILFGQVPSSPGLTILDVSRFAGQEVSLSFEAIGGPFPDARGSHYIDNITFAVPEPSTWVLLGTGLVFLVSQCRSRLKT